MEQAQEEKKPGKDMTPGELRGGKVASVSGSGMGLDSKGGRALTRHLLQRGGLQGLK